MNKQKLGFIIPYIKNEKLLNVFISYMNNYMKYNYEDIQYKIFIIEQLKYDELFKKSMLVNAGFQIYKSYMDYFVIQDVNILPISVNLNYPDKPLLLSCNIYENNITGYFFKSSTLSCSILMKRKDFFQINGVSNDSNELLYEDINIRLSLVKNDLVKHMTKQKDELITLGNYIEMKFENNYVQTETHKDVLYYDYLKNGLSTLKYEIIDKISYDNLNYEKCIVDFKNENINEET
jgi:hypothetical protein